MESFELLCGVSQVMVVVQGYEREAAAVVEDANWLKCHLSFRIEPVSGETDCSLMTTELEAFEKDLSRALERLESEASFQAYEEALSLRLVPDKHGEFKVVGSVKVYDTAKVGVSFEFACGLDAVRALHGGLRRVLREFPVRAVGA